jgi:IS30 family transposase
MNINEPLKQYVLGQLDQLWSPEQIAKRLKILYPRNMNMQISQESIYSYLHVLPRGALRQELVKCLRRKHINRRPRSGKSRRNCASIQDYLSIEERPGLPPIKRTLKLSDHGHFFVFLRAIIPYRRM